MIYLTNHQSLQSVGKLRYHYPYKYNFFLFRVEHDAKGFASGWYLDKVCNKV